MLLAVLCPSAAVFSSVPSRRSPLRLRQNGRKTVCHKYIIRLSSNDRFGFKLCCFPSACGESPSAVCKGKHKCRNNCTMRHYLTTCRPFIEIGATVSNLCMYVRILCFSVILHAEKIQYVIIMHKLITILNPNRSLDRNVLISIILLLLLAVLCPSAAVFSSVPSRRSPLRLRQNGRKNRLP